MDLGESLYSEYIKDEIELRYLLNLPEDSILRHGHFIS